MSSVTARLRETAREIGLRLRSRVWPTVRSGLRRAGRDIAACALFLILSAWVFHGLWPHPSTRTLAANPNDQTLVEWFLAHGVLFWTGDFSLLTRRLNYPDGINLMANASHILHGVIMAPVTAIWGPAVSFAVVAVANLAGTAAGWYLLLARGLELHRGAAVVGALLTGFGPGMISQSNSHLHITAQWLVPPMVWCVIRLARGSEHRRARTMLTAVAGLVALLTAQLFLGEEILFLTVVSLALFGIGYAACRPRWARVVVPRFAAGVVLAAGATLLLIAYPLWMQLDGPQHVPNAPFSPIWFYADLAGFARFSPLSIAGIDANSHLALDAAEYNTFFGLPLLVVVVASLVYGLVRWPHRRPVLVGVAVAGLVMTLFSFGPTVTDDGAPTSFPSLYHLIAGLPLVEGALPTRFALALLPLMAVVLAITIHECAREEGPLRVIAPLAIVLALLPIVPKPMATTDREPVPTFISAGGWRQCTPAGGVLVPVPLPTPQNPDAMRWAAQADDAFAIPEGFFIAPYGGGGKASIGIFPRSTSLLLAQVAQTGVEPEITDGVRDAARIDLGYWQADCVALAHVPNEVALRATLTDLLGPGTPIMDTWTWKVSAD